MTRKKVGESKVAVGNIRDISGEINIAGRDIYKGFTAEQVSLLIQQISTTFLPKAFDGSCPYKGLDAFEEEDVELFFGRERIVEDLIARVKDSRTLFITGPSGSGKSSLVRAGLIPALKSGGIKNSDRWLYQIIKPGRDPLQALAQAISRLKSPELSNYFRAYSNKPNALHDCIEPILSERKEQRLILFIDQFEEIFSPSIKEEKRTSFLNLLTYAATIESGRIKIIFAMRSDFVPNCASYPRLNSLLNQQFVQIGAMEIHELVNAIAQPALRSGLHIDPDLIAQVVKDTKGEPGILPLMQFAMKDLFDSQRAQGEIIALTLKDYLLRGGIHKSLERHADAAFAELSENEKILARAIFGGLIEAGRGTQATRRTTLFDELITGKSEIVQVRAVVLRLADARLVTTNEESGKQTVTISHEKLIEAWPWLRKLIDENREIIALQNEVYSDAKEWDDHGRHASYLYRGIRLANIREQLKKRNLELNATADEFIQASLWRQRFSQVAAFGSITMTILCLGAAVIIFANLSREALKQADTARANSLAALATSERTLQFDLALLLSIEGYLSEKNPRTKSALMTLADANPHLIGYLSGDTNSIYSVTYSPDGKILASGGVETKIILWDMADPANPKILSTITEVNSSIDDLVFSPAGNILASTSNLHGVILWDVSDPKHPSQISSITGYDNFFSNIAFSPDGKLLALSGLKSLVLWDISDPQKPVNLPSHFEGEDIFTNMNFSPNGKILAAGRGDTVILWNVENPAQPVTLSTLTETNSVVKRVAFDSSAQILSDYTLDAIHLWDVRNPKDPTILSTIPINSDFDPMNLNNRLVFTSENTILVIVNGSSISIWSVFDPQNPEELYTLSGDKEKISGLAVNPVDAMMVTGGEAGSLILWDINSNFLFNETPLTISTISSDGSLSGIDISSDGSTLAMVGLTFPSSQAQDSQIPALSLWDITAPSNPKTIMDKSEKGNDFADLEFSPNGKLLATKKTDETITLWRINDLTKISEFSTFEGSEYFDDDTIAFSPDGSILASGGCKKYNEKYKDFCAQGGITLWDVTNPSTPEKISSVKNDADINNVEFSPDGNTLAAGSAWSVTLWNLSIGSTPLELAKVSGGGNQIAFSPDGNTLATLSGSTDFDNSIILWDITNKLHLVQLSVLSGHHSTVTTIGFSPDGQTLASGSLDASIILWDISDPRYPSRLSTLLKSIDEPGSDISQVSQVAFSPDGKALFSVIAGTKIVLWDLNPDSWIQKACQRAGRNLTREEWEQYLPFANYPITKKNATCPQWPLDQ